MRSRRRREGARRGGSDAAAAAVVACERLRGAAMAQPAYRFGSQRSYFGQRFALQLSCIRRRETPRPRALLAVCLTALAAGCAASCWTCGDAAHTKNDRPVKAQLQTAPIISGIHPLPKPTRRVRSPPTPVASTAVGASLTLLQAANAKLPPPPLRIQHKHKSKKCVSSRSAFSARPRRARGPGPIERPSPGVV